MNLIPFVSSNLWAARMSPRLPSLIRSDSDTPWFWYFFATETTKRRFDRTSLSSASWSWVRMRCASATSSSREISGYALMSRRYWSSDPSSYADFRCGPGVPLIREPGFFSSRDSTRDEACDERRRVDARFLSVYPFSEPLPSNSREPGEALRGVRRIAVVEDRK